MTKYNLYYNYYKINRQPINESDLEKIRNQKVVYKNINGNNIKIPVSKIKFIRCIVL